MCYCVVTQHIADITAYYLKIIEHVINFVKNATFTLFIQQTTLSCLDSKKKDYQNCSALFRFLFYFCFCILSKNFDFLLLTISLITKSNIRMHSSTRNTFYGTRYLSHCYARFAFNPLFINWVTI